MNMIDVLYIVGTAHCGSTMLAFLLNSHPEIVSIGESAQSTKRDHDRHLHPCSCGEPIGGCPFWKAIFDRVTAQGYEFTPLKWVMSHGGSRRSKKLLYTSKSHPVADTVRRIALKTRGGSIRRQNDMNVAAMQAILDISGKRIYADASKSSARLELLMPEPRLNLHMLWLVRDVRGFAASMKNRGQSIKDAASRWRKEQEVYGRLFQRFPDGRRMLLRYEDLCRNPQKMMNEMFALVGAGPFTLPEDFRATTHHIIGHKMRLSGASTVVLKEKWRKALTDAEQKSVLDVAGETAVNLGYHP